MRLQFNSWTKKITITGAVLLLVSAWLALGPVSRLEQQVFRFFYEWPAAFIVPFAIITLLGSVWFIAPLLIVFIKKKGMKFTWPLILASLITAICVQVVKWLVARPRPYELWADIKQVESTFGSGYPSGHTAAATVLAVLLWTRIPEKFRPLLVAWVVGVGVSRMYLGVHAPLDIVGGVGIGLVVGGITEVVLNPAVHKRVKKTLRKPSK